MNLYKFIGSSYNRGDMVRKFLPGYRKWPDYERKYLGDISSINQVEDKWRLVIAQEAQGVDFLF